MASTIQVRVDDELKKKENQIVCSRIWEQILRQR